MDQNEYNEHSLTFLNEINEQLKSIYPMVKGILIGIAILCGFAVGFILK